MTDSSDPQPVSIQAWIFEHHHMPFLSALASLLSALDRDRSVLVLRLRVPKSIEQRTKLAISTFQFW